MQVYEVVVVVFKLRVSNHRELRKQCSACSLVVYQDVLASYFDQNQASVWTKLCFVGNGFKQKIKDKKIKSEWSK